LGLHFLFTGLVPLLCIFWRDRNGFFFFLEDPRRWVHGFGTWLAPTRWVFGLGVLGLWCWINRFCRVFMEA